MMRVVVVVVVVVVIVVVVVVKSAIVAKVAVNPKSHPNKSDRYSGPTRASTLTL